MTIVNVVYRELHFPSRRTLALRLHTRRGHFIWVPLGEPSCATAVRQICGPPSQYHGHDKRTRMNGILQDGFATMISKFGGGACHILLGMDNVSRHDRVHALNGSVVGTVATVFEPILQEVGAKPTQLITDGGGAFSSSFPKTLHTTGY